MKKRKLAKIFTAVILLVSLCICGTFSVLASVEALDANAATNPNASTTTVLYEETFDDIIDRVDLVNGKNTGAADGWTYAKKTTDGSAYIENGKLHLSGNNYDVIYRTGKSWSNYTLEADICYMDTTDADGWSGMLYNVQSDNTFQKAGLNPNQKYSLNGMVNGRWDNNKNGVNVGFSLSDDVKFDNGTPVRLKVVTYDNIATLYYALLNDDGSMQTDYIKLLRINNISEETRSGSIGFMTSTGASKFASITIDNIKVTNVLYEENFDDITDKVSLVNGENTGLADGWTYAKKTTDGEAYIEDGKLHISGKLYDVVYRTGESWSNYTLEADIGYKSGTASKSFLGLLYNVQDDINFQKAGLSMAESYSLNGMVKGSWKNDVSGTNKGFTLEELVDTTTPFRLKIVTNENVASLYYAFIDNSGTMKSDYIHLLTISNIPAETLSGSIGVMTAKVVSKGWIDNIRVTSNSFENEVSLPTAAEIYEPETGIVNPPVVVEKLTSVLPAANGERAAVVIADIDENLNILDKNGAVLTTASEFIDTYRKVIIPAFVVDSEEEADALAVLMHKKNLTDAYVVADSENANLVRRVRMANKTTNLITGALMFGDLNSSSARSVARELVVDNMSYVAISDAPVTEETVFYFAKRQVSVWCSADSTAEIYRGIANGYHGIVSENCSAVYDVYESITTPTVSGRTVVIAHRGANSKADIKYPENTLMGIRAAKEVYGADCVEIDFGLTKDGYIILMHDDTVDRTTNGTGNFSDLTLEEIKALTVDVVAGKETTVPTLEEVLVLAKELDIVL